MEPVYLHTFRYHRRNSCPSCLGKLLGYAPELSAEKHFVGGVVAAVNSRAFTVEGSELSVRGQLDGIFSAEDCSHVPRPINLCEP